MDSADARPSLLGRWWDMSGPRPAADIGTALALFFVEVVVYVLAAVSALFTLAPRTAVEVSRAMADVQHWTVGIIVASAVIFVAAVVRRAPVTATVHLLVAMGVALLLLPLSAPAAAPTRPTPLPSYYEPCYSGEHNCERN